MKISTDPVERPRDGKTLIAEALPERLWRPLYTVGVPLRDAALCTDVYRYPLGI